MCQLSPNLKERVHGHPHHYDAGLHVEHSGAGRDVTVYRERTFDQRAFRPDRVGMSQKHDWRIAFAWETDQHVVASIFFGHASGCGTELSEFVGQQLNESIDQCPVVAG